MRENAFFAVAGVLSILFLSCGIKMTKQAETYLDPVSGLEWQVTEQKFVYLADAKAYCDSLKLTKKDDWRLPTIDELRTLVRGCDNTMPGGDCRISDPDCLDYSCQDIFCEWCDGIEKGPSPRGWFWDAEAEELFFSNKQSSFFSSASLFGNHSDTVWGVQFATGKIDASDEFFHCVRTAAPLAVGDKCTEGTSFCRDNNAYNCVEEKLALTAECSKNDAVCYDDAVSGAQCGERPPMPIIGLEYPWARDGLRAHPVLSDLYMDASATCPMRDDLDEATMKKCQERLISDTTVTEHTMTTADFMQQCCLPDWKDRYCIKHRWKVIESPTLIYEESLWDSTCYKEEHDIGFRLKGQMITPTPDGKYYKVQMEAKTVDRLTGVESDITKRVDAPDITESARVMVQLTWKEGLQNRAELDQDEGYEVDLDIHLIKKKGMDSCGIETGAEGLMCTSKYLSTPPGCPGTATHDDCHFGDPGCAGLPFHYETGISSGMAGRYRNYECNVCEGEITAPDARTIAWHASLYFDNTWGGGDYTSPEMIGFGPINDWDPQDGQPDVFPFTDDYLVVVNYSNCENLKTGGDNTPCQPGGENYNVHARVNIFIDGIEAPREGRGDEGPLLYKDFVIRPNEWIVVAKITWDQTLMGKWPGDAIVYNPDPAYDVCKFGILFCHELPIWDPAAYETRVTADSTIGDPLGANGTCYEYGTRE